MKSYHSFHRKLYPYSNFIERVGYLLLTITSLVLGVSKQSAWLENRPIVSRFIEFVEDYAICFFGTFFSLVLLGILVKSFGNIWVWDKIKFILDEYQGKAFSVSQSDPQDHHRVTLFKHVKYCVFRRHWSARFWWKPWGDTPLISSYLVPVLRSGHMSQKSSALFHVPDNSDKAEGVAGQAWSAQNAIIASGLPDVNREKVTTRDKRDYSKNTNSDVDMVEEYISRGRPLPRSIAAIPVEVKGKPWGVVVLDSRAPNGVQEQSVLNYSLTVALLGQLLEEA